MLYKIALLGAALIPALAGAQSRIEPPKEELGIYIIDRGQGLDTGCSYRGEGPLLINVPLPVAVNPDEINSEGFLKDPQKLIKNKVIGKTAQIFFPAYDVDDKAAVEPPYQPEIDLIKFNGKVYGKKKLEGLNNTWIMQSIEVPITEIKFGDGNKNLLRIDIDVGNEPFGAELWCTAVDWVGVSFDVAAPYVLAHGIAADLTTWDEANGPKVLQYLNELGIRWERFSAQPNGSVGVNARLLHDQLVPWLKELRSDRLHVIAHSKGGLDYQMMRYIFKDKAFKILSLSTLSTPHWGSVSADLNVLERRKIANFAFIENESPDPGGWVDDYLDDVWQSVKLGKGPSTPGINDLQTRTSAQAIASKFRGNISPTFTIGANADANGNGKLDKGEGKFLASSWGWASTYLMENTWEVMRRYSSAQYIRTDTNWFGLTTLVFTTTAYDTPKNNDVVVTLESANPGYGTPVRNDLANHTMVKNLVNVRALVEQTIELK